MHGPVPSERQDQRFINQQSYTVNELVKQYMNINVRILQTIAWKTYIETYLQEMYIYNRNQKIAFSSGGAVA